MESVCCDHGLHNSWTKTKIENIGAGKPARTIMVGVPQVEGVENFTYLGCLYMCLVVPVLQCASEIWTTQSTTSLDLEGAIPPSKSKGLHFPRPSCNSARIWKAQLQQEFHMRCHRRTLGVHKYEHATNIAVARRTNLSLLYRCSHCCKKLLSLW